MCWQLERKASMLAIQVELLDNSEETPSKACLGEPESLWQFSVRLFGYTVG